MAAKNEFGSKIGLIAATVGSAVGLGNVWRFPAETQANGGAAFLLLYILCIFILGIPVMLAEFSLGRGGKSDSIGVFQKLSPRKKWWLVGAFGIIASYLITCFYMVVEGWTAEYLWQSISGGLYDAVAGADTSTVAGNDARFLSKMEEYISGDFRPVLFTVIVIIVNIGILLGGVQKGIEKLSNILMPLLFVALVVLCCVTLSLPGAGEGISWFLTPDFSKITTSTVINALGQTFFSLSLGMGILITYASYYPPDTNLGRTSVIVSLASLLVAVLVGFVIFPAVANFGLADHSLKGATLVFQTLPEVFDQLPATRLWSSVFFILLFVAALTSTVSLCEVTIAFLRDHFNFKRTKAVLTTLLPLLIFSPICSLSFGSLSEFKIFGLTIFDLLDTFATNILLPLVSIGVCVYIGWFAPRDLLDSQLTNNGSLKFKARHLVEFIIKYIAPIIIALILITAFL